jgi:hypothetical protein
MSSISSTLRPVRNGRRYSSTAVFTTSARWVKVAQPQPTRPGSVVSIFTITRRMPLGAVRIVLTSRILTGAMPLVAGAACSSAARAAAGNSAALPAIDSALIISRRFIRSS